MARAPGRRTGRKEHPASPLGSKRAAARLLLAGALGAVLLTCARDTTGPALASIQLTVQGPDSVGVAQSINLTASLPQGADPTRVRITWKASDTSLVRVSPAGLSTTVYGRRLGEDTITATLTAPDLPSGVSETHVLTVRPGAPAQLLVTTQPSDSARAGKPFARQPVLQIADSGGNAVAAANVRVAAALDAGTGTLANDTALSAPSGAVPFSGLALTATVGSYALRFSTPAGTLAPVVSSAFQLTPGDPGRLVVTTQPPATVKAGVVFGPPPEVQLADAAGNAVAQAGLPVRARITSGTASVLAADSVATDAGGLAVFAGMVVGGAATASLTLTFTTGPFADTSTAFALVAGDPASLGLVAPLPGSARSGVPIAPAPQVRIVDGFDNTVPMGGVTITASLASGAGTLGGVTALPTDSSGIATFADLILAGPVGPYAVTFSAGGQSWQPVTSGSIGLTSGPAARLAFTVQPSNVVAGVPIAPAVQVTVYDTTGNVITDAANGIKLAISANPGADTLGGTDSVAAANGVAVFPGLTLRRSATGYTLVATSSGLQPATSAPFDVSAAAAAQLAPNSDTSFVDTVGTPVKTRPSVRVTDPFGNGIPAETVSFAVTGGGGTLSGGTQVTDATGAATVGGWTLGTVTGVNTMTAAAGSLAGSPVTFTASARPGAPSPTTSVVTVAADSVRAGSSVAALLTTKDRFGNLLTAGGASVAFTHSGGTSTGTFGAVVDSGNGRYTAPFTGGAVGTPTTIGATIAGVDVVTPLPTVRVVPGAPAQVVITAGNGLSATVGTATQVAPAVVVRDAYDNAVPGVGVTFAVTGGGGSVTPATPVTTDAAGAATATRWILGLTAGPNALTATAGGASAVFAATGTLPTLLTTVALGDAYMGRSPAGIGVNRTTNRVYVANTSSGTVTVLDGTSNAPLASIAVGTGPATIAVNATTNRVYVVLSTDQLAVINGATNAVTGTVSFPSGSSARGVAVNESANRIYVALDDNNAVAVVDGAALTYTTIGGMQDARQVAFNPSTNRLYVTWIDGQSTAHKINVFDASTNGLITTISALGGIPAENIALDPVANRVYFSGANPAIGVIDGATNTLLTTIPVTTTPAFAPPSSTLNGSAPVTQALAVDPGSGLVYATSDNGTLAVIDGTGGSVVGTLAVGSRPAGVAVNASNGKWYASLGAASAVLALPGGSTTVEQTLVLASSPTGVGVNRATGEIWVANAGSGNVLVLDGATHALRYALPAGTTPAKVGVDATRNRIYLSSSGADSVTILDGAAHAFASQVHVGTAPEGVAVMEGLNRVYVANSGSGSISVIDGATGTVSTTLPLGSGNPTDLAAHPAAGAVFVCQDDQYVRRLDTGTNTFSAPVLNNGYCDALAVNGRNGLVYPEFHNVGNHGLAIFDATLTAVAPSYLFLSLTTTALAADPTTGVLLAGMSGETDVISGDLNAKVGQLSLTGAASGLAVNPANGRFYVTDAGNATLRVIQQ
jgi:YVTN family beta-propeller protein